MFRLAEFDERCSVYRQMSETASRTITRAIDGWVNTVYDIEEIYWMYFGAESGSDFFAGISEYLPLSSVRPVLMKRRAEPDPFRTETAHNDDLIGMEFLWRKIERMREKMDDPAEYYTFDLFEEYVFDLMIEIYQFQRDEEAAPDIKDKILEMAQKIELACAIEEEGSMEMAASLYRIERMGINDSDLFFWDDDFAIVFQESFIKGIRSITGGLGAILGYSYENACSIFTDAGYTVPLMLTGTKAAFDIKGDLARENRRKIPNPFDEPGEWDEFFGTDDTDTYPDEDLPFS